MTASATSSALGGGLSFDVFDPDPEVITPGRIARALAHTCRYGGHTPEFYSVAQHSVLVSRVLMDETANHRLALEGLMHDAAEAFLVDLPRPIKYAKGFETFRALDEKLGDLIAALYGLPWPMSKAVKVADDRMLLTERRDLDMAGGSLWPDVEPYPDVRINPWSPNVARIQWLDAFEYHEGRA